MADFTAQDVKALRDATGAGFMDAKKALTENDGNFEEATAWLRERGLGKAAERADRESAEGAVAVARSGDAAALVELKSETDFVAKSPQFVAMVQSLAESVAADGEGVIDAQKDALDDLRITLKENIQVGRVVRLAADAGQVLDTYVHVQNGRGVNAVLVQVEGGNEEMAHDLAVHIAFGKPSVLSRDEVPAEDVAAERTTLEAQTRNEGKPEAAIEKIVEGKVNGWYKRVPGGVLLEQPYAKDDKKSVTQFLGGAKIVRFAQAVIGS
ncbi:MAG TPA: translation elongation factor Ts [Acidimicrobiales bacterium]|jgi:elongation factor Ts|nr:translation elongation factor Ts [Acidimicrobiales bacterium]